MITTLCNPNASPNAKRLMEYLASIEGKRILTGQHTLTMAQEELHHVGAITGKLPAVCGFELLSYSPNIRLETGDEACVREVLENRGTLQRAWEWAQQGGILTFTWHWYSPLGGRDKAFYAWNTDFDPSQAIIEGTQEHRAMCSDLDHMAALLQPFCDADVPILWRPFHEAEGNWFWWGAKGPDVARKLYQFMFRYYTQHHHLDNLVWVWTSPLPDGYVGDDCCDIISRDMYPAPHAHSAFEQKLTELRMITTADKGAAIAETGIIPDPDELARLHTPWLWYMTWSGGFALTEDHNSYDALRKLYHHEYAITLDQLPAWLKNAN